jgi:hypothetical protein
MRRSCEDAATLKASAQTKNADKTPTDLTQVDDFTKAKNRTVPSSVSGQRTIYRGFANRTIFEYLLHYSASRAAAAAIAPEDVKKAP